MWFCPLWTKLFNTAHKTGVYYEIKRLMLHIFLGKRRHLMMDIFPGKGRNRKHRITQRFVDLRNMNPIPRI